MQEKISCSKSISLWKNLREKEKKNKLLKGVTFLGNIWYKPNGVLQRKENN